MSENESVGTINSLFKLISRAISNPDKFKQEVAQVVEQNPDLVPAVINHPTIDEVVENPSYKPREIVKRRKKKKYHLNKAYDPNLHDIVRYFKHNEIIGEESVYLISTLAFLGGQSVIVEGPSGSGKSKIQEVMLSLFPKDFVYKISSTTFAAMFNDCGKINHSHGLFVPEFQKVVRNKDIRELFKDISNGDSFTRRLASNKPGIVKELRIRKGLSLHTSIANQNDFKKVFNNYIESFRRFIHVYTRMDKGVTKRVLKAKAKKCFNPYSNKIMAMDEISNVSNHLAAITNLNGIVYINPFANYISDMIPTDNDIVSAFANHFWNLVNTYARFHVQKRLRAEDKITRDKIVFCNFEDIKRVHDLYAEHFVVSLKQIDTQNKLDNKDLDAFCDGIDWQACFDYGINEMHNHDKYNKIFDNWIKYQQIEDGGWVYSIDPITGIKEGIAKYDESVLNNSHVSRIGFIQI